MNGDTGHTMECLFMSMCADQCVLTERGHSYSGSRHVILVAYVYGAGSSCCEAVHQPRQSKGGRVSTAL